MYKYGILIRGSFGSILGSFDSDYEFTIVKISVVYGPDFGGWVKINVYSFVW